MCITLVGKINVEILKTVCICQHFGGSVSSISYKSNEVFKGVQDNRTPQRLQIKTTFESSTFNTLPVFTTKLYRLIKEYKGLKDPF